MAKSNKILNKQRNSLLGLLFILVVLVGIVVAVQLSARKAYEDSSAGARACSPKSTSCSGGILKVCNSSGTGYSSTGKKC